MSREKYTAKKKLKRKRKLKIRNHIPENKKVSGKALGWKCPTNPFNFASC